MFATIVVVLPSLFQGGEAHLSHGDLSTTIDSSSQSLTNISVLAWYTDVVHEIKPITGGYRLAIALNLIQTANSRPKLPETSDFLTKLRHVLLSWKQRPASTVPTKLIYLLQHKYSLASLRGNCLKGTDAYKVALLQSLAKQLNFDVGLANVECHLVGYGDGGYGSEDDDDVGMAEVEERNMSIENLVDLDGGHIQDEVECKEDDSEFCPQNLRANIEAGEPDEREYEGYQGNVRCSILSCYRIQWLIYFSGSRVAGIMSVYLYIHDCFTADVRQGIVVRSLSFGLTATMQRWNMGPIPRTRWSFWRLRMMTTTNVACSSGSFCAVSHLGSLETALPMTFARSPHSGKIWAYGSKHWESAIRTGS